MFNSIQRLMIKSITKTLLKDSYKFVAQSSLLHNSIDKDYSTFKLTATPIFTSELMVNNFSVPSMNLDMSSVESLNQLTKEAVVQKLQIISETKVNDMNL